MSGVRRTIRAQPAPEDAMNASNMKQILSVEDMVNEYQFSKSWLYDYTGGIIKLKNKLLFYRVGRRLRFRREDVEAWIVKQQAEAMERIG
jgi:predicted DNA-binding transcriptional regulator AlpA